MSTEGEHKKKIYEIKNYRHAYHASVCMDKCPFARNDYD